MHPFAKLVVTIQLTALLLVTALVGCSDDIPGDSDKPQPFKAQNLGEGVRFLTLPDGTRCVDVVLAINCEFSR